MLCEECGKNQSTVHLTKIINGKVNKVHLCEECAKKHKTLDFDSTFSIHDFFAGLLDNTDDSTLSLGQSAKIQCDNCGMTYSKFRQSGRLGCNECYNSFKDKLIPLFKRIHGHDNHTGKVPKRAGGIIRIKKDIEDLRKNLSIAVREEEFEEAARLRDKIKDLEKEIEMK
ncbi:UvrB/UvrC motif-containing protein [Sporosalibacterium faouarense]|uniref:UvrB/UvrC motif-containing protein n=1 Tax=Sporosalibacterium faouarense TaxID=516123 RepID=UPI00141CFFE6|nr:UvrB/UvrC motif-containing protein [Sporosalibacterium faouarense]MTI48375.1 hypothetical protein [Bacillota bacterium]